MQVLIHYRSKDGTALLTVSVYIAFQVSTVQLTQQPAWGESESC